MLGLVEELRQGLIIQLNPALTDLKGLTFLFVSCGFLLLNIEKLFNLLGKKFLLFRRIFITVGSVIATV